MGAPVKRRATYDDLLAVPDHKIAEIVDGETSPSFIPATTSSSPTWRDGAASGCRSFPTRPPSRSSTRWSRALEVYRLSGTAWLLLATH
jgi:hypothetical protein